MILSILLALLCAFLAYNLCRENKILPLVVLYFIINIITNSSQLVTPNMVLYAIIYLVYSILQAYLSKLAYGLSSSFIGFIIIDFVLNVVTGYILIYVLTTIIII